MKNKTATLLALTGLAVTALALGGCGDSKDENGERDAETASATARFGKPTLELAQSIAELRGHYIAAKELYAKGDYAGAKVHADHPVEELYKSFRQAVAERDPKLDAEIKRSLDEGVELIAQRAPAEKFDRLVDNTSGPLMDRVLKVAAPKVDPNDPLFRAAMAANIVKVAGDEYTEAVKDGKVKLVAEYQDSYGFVTYCRVLTDGLGSELGSQRTSVGRKLTQLDDGPYATGVEPPQKPKPTATVASGTAAVVEELEDALGSELLLSEADPQEELDQVSAGLKRVVTLYEDGSKTAAVDEAAKVYIDHFEAVEAPLAEANAELMEDLEQQIGVKLPDLLRTNASVAKVKSAVSKIESLLPEARKALNQESDSY